MAQMAKVDPISKDYYKPIEEAERKVFCLFIIGGLLSIAILLLDSDHKLYGILQILFLLTGLALFTLNHLLRLWLIPRAEEKRVKDFLTSAYGLTLTPDITNNYYNNDQKPSPRRAGLQLLENLFFTKTVSGQMLKYVRPLCFIYIIGWTGLAFFHGIELQWLLVLAQILFSEEVLSKWLRLEWLNARVSELYDEVFLLFSTKMTTSNFQILIVDKFVIYEKIKALLAITLSSKIFNKLNPDLSVQWEQIRKPLETTWGQK